MAVPVTRIPYHEVSSTLRALECAGGTGEHLDWMCVRSNAALLLRFIDERRGLVSNTNPFAMSVEDQLASLRRANEEEGWGISDEEFVRLAATAPEWPTDVDAYRSLRIRFGEGSAGVAETFEAHSRRIRRVFGEGGFYRWDYIHSRAYPHNGVPVERLRLLRGAQTHRPVVEWIVADLNMHRSRLNVSAVRGARSLADELLVIAWLFPSMVRSMDCGNVPWLFGAGYEIHIPERHPDEWAFVLVVNFNHDNGRIYLHAVSHENGSSGYAVPTLRE